MKYSEMDGSVVFEQDGVIGRTINTENSIEYVRLTLEIGSQIPEHSVPFAATFYVISGSGEISIDGSTTPIVAGDLVEVALAEARGIKNTGKTTLEVLVVKHLR